MRVEDLYGNIDFAILTMREDELEAVLERLPNRAPVSGRQLYEYADVVTATGSSRGVVVARCKQGQIAAQSATADIIRDLDPKWILLVGIAGGVPDETFTLGDVCIADRLHDFSVSAAAEGTPPTYQQAGGPVHVDVERLLNALPAFRYRLSDWNTSGALGREKPRIELPSGTSSDSLYGDDKHRRNVLASLARHFPDGRPTRAPIFRIGPGAGGSVLVKDTVLLHRWQESARHLTHVEMEAGGCFEAARKAGEREYPLLCIRGLSDIVGFKRGHEWTEFACHSAASFAIGLISSDIVHTYAKNPTASSSSVSAASASLSWLAQPPQGLRRDIRSPSSMIRDRAREFIGRERLIREIDERTSGRHGRSGYVLVRGEPGMGKSSLMAHIASTRGYAHHFNVAADGITSTASFLRNACAQLIVRYDLAYRELPPHTDQDAQVLSALLEEAGNSQIAKAEGRLLLLVDALDESDPPSNPRNNRLLLPTSLPDGTYIIGTIRNNIDPHLTVDHLIEELVLEGKSEENELDIRQYIKLFINANQSSITIRLSDWQLNKKEFEDRIWTHSEGNFMYVRHVLPDILSRDHLGRNTLGVDELPLGLRSYYARHWAMMRSPDSARFTRVQQPILCMLAIAREAVSVEDVVRWIKESDELEPVTAAEVRHVFKEWAQYIHTDDSNPPRHRLYHQSFLDFLEVELKDELATYRRAKAAALDATVDWPSS